MAIYVALGVGVGNLGRGRAPRRPMLKWVDMMNMDLSHGHPSVRIVGFFGHTANFLADSASTDLEQVTARFRGLLATDWVVCPIADMVAALIALDHASKPQEEYGIRWTRGLAIHGAVSIAWGTVTTTPRAVLWTISPGIIGVWKRDNIGPDATLDRIRRRGGWGAISDDIGSQIGGRWTARSYRTVNGLVRKSGYNKTE